ncbi:hypothetical protein FPV67DRAFT_1449870 [Lyophyllum atratum]|nr:hypothetical protein FPV67DRAFT_1449870 [Lyophyllum atratum]
MASDKPKDMYPLKKGFRRHHPLWYRSDDKFSTDERNELLEYLNTMFEQLKSEDHIRWEELGVCQDVPIPHTKILRKSDDLQGKERHEYVRNRVFDIVTWRIARLLRYTHPIRLGEAVDALEYGWKVHQWMNPGQPPHYDVIYSIFLATARERRGGDSSYHEKTLEILPLRILADPRVGRRNFILGCCTLARLYRHLGRDAEDQMMVRKIAEWIDAPLRQYALTPYEFWQNMDQDTMSRVIAYLGRDPFDGIINEDPHTAVDTNIDTTYSTALNFINPYYQGEQLPNIPLETDKRSLKRECWISGCRVKEELRQCAACGNSVKLLIREHQREAWPRHKPLCDRYRNEKALYKGLD